MNDRLHIYSEVMSPPPFYHSSCLFWCVENDICQNSIEIVPNTLVAMDAKRDAVIALYLKKKSTLDIVRELKHLNVNRKFVYRTIKRYKETGDVKDKPRGGRPRSATKANIIANVKKLIEQNPKRSSNELAQEMGISRSSMARILKEDLGLKAYKCQNVQEFIPNQKIVGNHSTAIDEAKGEEDSE